MATATKLRWEKSAGPAAEPPKPARSTPGYRDFPTLVLAPDLLAEATVDEAAKRPQTTAMELA